MDTITPQIQEVLRLMKTYVGVCERARQAHREYRRAELNLLRIRVARLARLIELKRAYQARRQRLLLDHPYGYIEELGHDLSDASLEAMKRATRLHLLREQPREHFGEPEEIRGSEAGRVLLSRMIVGDVIR
jgi:hypothetical protein